MKTYYLTPEGMPVKASHPQPDWTEISEEDYIKICDQKNKEIEEEQKKLDEQMKPKLEQRKRIQAKMKELALQELGEEEII